jgi:hypothetical protein
VSRLKWVPGSPKPPASLLAEFHEELYKFAGAVGLLPQGVGIAKTFAFEIDDIDLIATQMQIPVIAENA